MSVCQYTYNVMFMDINRKRREMKITKLFAKWLKMWYTFRVAFQMSNL